jgi:hypothetical protein
MNYTMVETGGDEGINGGIGSTPEGAPAGETFYVSSDDAASSLQRAEELGGRMVAGPMDMQEAFTYRRFRHRRRPWRPGDRAKAGGSAPTRAIPFGSSPIATIPETQDPA